MAFPSILWHPDDLTGVGIVIIHYHNFCHPDEIVDFEFSQHAVALHWALPYQGTFQHSILDWSHNLIVRSHGVSNTRGLRLEFPKFITATPYWERWRLKSPASRLSAQPFDQAQIKEHIKAPRHLPLWGESIGNRSIPITKVTRNMLPFDDVIMRFEICKVSRQQCLWSTPTIKVMAILTPSLAGS